MLWVCVLDPTQFPETVETQPDLGDDGQDCTDDTAECDTSNLPKGERGICLQGLNKRGVTTQTFGFVGAETPNQHISRKLIEYAEVLSFFTKLRFRLSL